MAARTHPLQGTALGETAGVSVWGCEMGCSDSGLVAFGLGTSGSGMVGGLWEGGLLGNQKERKKKNTKSSVLALMGDEKNCVIMGSLCNVREASASKR